MAINTYIIISKKRMDFLQIVSEVGFPIAGAGAAGQFSGDGNGMVKNIQMNRLGT